MRSAGCTVNDMWDRHIDARVERTIARPLAAGRLSLLAAALFLAAQLSVGLALLLQLDPVTITAGVAVVPIVMAYPLAKRVTHFPQVILGCAMNYGVIMGVTAGSEAVRNGVDVNLIVAAAALYAGSIAWTVVYDTLYALQDVRDDARLGLKSTALWMGSRARVMLTALSLATGAAWHTAGVYAGISQHNLIWDGAVAAAVGHMLWTVNATAYTDRLALTRAFVSNKWVGAIMLAGIMGASATAPQQRLQRE